MEAIARLAFPKAQTINCEWIGRGNINRTFRLEVDGEKYILQCINGGVFEMPEDVMSNHEWILRQFMENGALQIELPQLVPFPDKKKFFKDKEGRYWRVLNFIEHSDVGPNPGSQTVGSAARMLGKFLTVLNQKHSSPLKVTIPDFHNLSGRYQQFLHAISVDRVGRVQKADFETRYIQLAFRYFSDLDISGLPKRIVHNDPKLENFLFDQSGKAIAVIDWDTVMPGYLFTDFGEMIRTLCNTTSEDDPVISSVDFDVDHLLAICQYLLPEVKGWLHESEEKSLTYGASYIALEQAIRFLTDYLNGDEYYRTDYATHNLVRARNQISFHQKVIEYQQEIEETIAIYTA